MRFYVEQVPDPREPGMHVSKVLAWEHVYEPEADSHRVIAGPFATRAEASEARGE
jgi:hypothetical protein